MEDAEAADVGHLVTVRLMTFGGGTVETVLLHKARQSTFDAVRQRYAVQPKMGKAGDI